jgi:hypothetical protein
MAEWRCRHCRSHLTVDSDGQPEPCWRHPKAEAVPPGWKAPKKKPKSAKAKASQPPAKQGRKKGKKRKRPKLAGLGSVLPRAVSRSIVVRTATRARGTTSGGLPGLGKRR